MITAEDEKFFAFWEKNRLKEKSLFKQLSFGMPIGLLIGAGIILNLVTGWYTRANMVANSQSTPIVLLIAIAGITLFCSVFFKRHQWDLREQRYLEILKKKEKAKTAEAMQQV